MSESKLKCPSCQKPLEVKDALGAAGIWVMKALQALQAQPGHKTQALVSHPKDCPLCLRPRQ